MKVSINWLKEYLDLPQSPEEIAHALTLAGLESEGQEDLGDDVILDIGLTPNLGHCMSILGMARELSAILQIPLKKKTFPLTESKSNVNDLIDITIEEGSGCNRYLARIVQNVKVGPSPDWLQKKLERSGLRCVNNVVDIGNLVMLELGQPLHMFDYDKLHGAKIAVRSAKSEDKIQTLDEVEREIPDGVLLICDDKRPIAFAGVMGELSSSVSDSTQNILIEAAHFTPSTARKTSKLLNLRSDSSLRFERGIDPLAIESALDMAASLLKGDICQGIAKKVTTDYKPHIVEMNPQFTNRLLGTHLSLSEMSSLLKRLEIEIIKESEEVIRVKPPSYRNDLRSEIDLIEEVGRMYGFNNIERKLPRHVSSTLTHSPLYLFEEEIRSKLAGQGLQECLTCDLISPKQADLSSENSLGKESHIHVLYPASIDQSVLRPSLLPGLLQVIKFNLDRQNLSIAAFEVGHVHFKQKDKVFGEPSAGIILTGFNSPYHFENKPDEADFFSLKGHVENLLDSVGLDGATFSPSHLKNFHPGRQARVSIDGIDAGALGEIHPQHLRVLGIDQRVFYAEINLHNLIDLKKTHHSAQTFSLYPGSERDWTITISDKIPVGTILNDLKSSDSDILENVFLLDLYKSEKIGKDSKNVTLRFQYRDPNKTVAAEDVEKEHKRLTLAIAEKLRNSVL